MKLIHTNQLKPGMFLAQNLYRHDGLLLLPKGVKISRFEHSIIHDSGRKSVLVMSKRLEEKHDLNFTLNIIETAFVDTQLWKKSFGKKLYNEVKNKIVKNKKTHHYLNKLRNLDSYSFVHCINVSILVALMLKNEEKIEKMLVDACYLVLLHDVGRIKTKSLFKKKKKLTDKEFKQLQKHPIHSYKLLKKTNIPDNDLRAIVEHHERFDGTGYPMKLKGKEISHLAQLINIADVYNGMSSYRPYRRPIEIFNVLKYIEGEKNKAFGERYIGFFFERFSPYKIGMKVELNNGDTAVIKKINPKKKMLPIVEIYNDNMMRPISINLEREEELNIVKILNKESG